MLDAALRVEPGLRAYLDLIHCAAGDELCEEGRPFRSVYFPLSGVISCLVRTRDGGISEVMSVGREGLIGLPLYLGVKFSPFDLLQQIPGTSARLPVQLLRECVSRHASLAQLLHCYAAYELRVACQQSVCQTAHPLAARIARWLLVAHDRAGTARFQLPQQILAHMLGANRSSVSTVTSAFARAGLLGYRRLWVTLRDRAGLEGVACECYAVMEHYRRRLLGPHARAS